MAGGLRMVGAIADVDARAWDGLANPPDQDFNPFVTHAFLKALEDSGSVGGRTGWQPQHLVLERDGRIVGLAPCYLKSHSMGEYVFDHAFADAFQRAGGAYYPKLQVAVPFTPVTGPRLLAATGTDKSALARGLAAAAKKYDLSSAHVTFLSEGEAEQCTAPDFLQRQDIQFHWFNKGYASFEDFLASLSSAKRKNIRKERRIVAEAGITFEQVMGSALKEEHWDHFYRFYMDTGSRKWGQPYLNRKFFSRIHETMNDHILLVLAKRNGRIIAGALNFIGSASLYGRNWGAAEDHPFLHFETCYYQAIDFAIAHRLKVVEAGAQGEHKLARGYVPVKTHSLHHFAHPGLARAAAEYLAAERKAIDENQQLLAAHAPFRNEQE